MKIVFAFCVTCITFQLVCKRRVEIRIVYALEVKDISLFKVVVCCSFSQKSCDFLGHSLYNLDKMILESLLQLNTDTEYVSISFRVFVVVWFMRNKREKVVQILILAS